MRKSQFEQIARALHDARGASAPSADSAARAHSAIFDSLCRSIADTLAGESGRFNRVRFLHACGVSGESLKKDLTPIQRFRLE